MSEHTKQLEFEAATALRHAMYLPEHLRDIDAADRAVWKIVEATVAKVQENLLAEANQIRRVAGANPGETTYRAVKRITKDRAATFAKYKRAQREFDRVHALAVELGDKAREVLDALELGAHGPVAESDPFRVAVQAWESR